MTNYDGVKLRWANRRIHTARLIFGEVLYEPGGFCGPRNQRDYELVVVHAGSCRVTLNGVVHALPTGQVFLFRPGGREHFQFDSNLETHHSYCSATPRLFPAAMRRLLDRAPLATPQSEVFRLLLTAAFKLRPPRQRATTRMIEQLGLCLFSEFLNAAGAAAEHVGADPCVQSFLHHVEDHFEEEQCLAGAVKASGVSRNTLLVRLRAELGTTPSLYLWRYRAERGAAMLAETGHTVAEVAYRCGFKNPFHFSRVVKRIVGRAPRDIRQQAWFGAAHPADAGIPNHRQRADAVQR